MKHLVMPSNKNIISQWQNEVVLLDIRKSFIKERKTICVGLVGVAGTIIYTEDVPLSFNLFILTSFCTGRISNVYVDLKNEPFWN